MIAAEVQLQVADHFRGATIAQHASRHLDELDPFTRLRASGHTTEFTTFAGRYGAEFRGGVTAESRPGQPTLFTVVIADDLPAADEERVAEWAWLMIRSFEQDGPMRWTSKGEGRWQVLARTVRMLDGGHA